jgi:hypothetical protein
MKFNALACGIVARAAKRFSAPAVAPAAGVDLLTESALLTPVSVCSLPAMGLARLVSSSLLSQAVAARCQELPYAFIAR